MRMTWKVASLASLLFSANASAELIPSGPSGNSWLWVGDYVTAEALFSECVSLATRIGEDPVPICGAAPSTTPTSYAAGWYYDRTQPPGTWLWYYFHAYACGTSGRFKYFYSTLQCEFVDKINEPIPSSPKANGPFCPANPQDNQPSCGNPISPGSGTKVQREVDFIPSTAGLPLELVRTYNGGQFSGLIDAKGVFGSRWSSILDRKIWVRSSQAPMQCFRRSPDNFTYCELPKSDSSGQSAVVSRPDGKLNIFNRTGNQWIADADVNERLNAQYAPDGVTPVSWSFTTVDRNVEQYDANGRLISVTSPSGAWQRFTYSTGNSNDTASARIPEDAPVCANVQGGPAIAADLAVCVTDNWGRQIQFEYDAKKRVSKAIDPAGQEYFYKYDGESAGCDWFNPSSATCLANNLTDVTYPGNKTRKYHYNEWRLINGGNSCGGGSVQLPNSLTGITDENGIRFATWGWSCDNRAISSEHAGGVDKTTISYGGRASDGSNVVTVTSNVGTAAAPEFVVRKYNFKVSLGVSKVTGLDQPCEGCNSMRERIYDSNNNVSSSKDWLGSKTVYTYENSRNLETSRTEAQGTTLARTTTTEWHPTMRLRTGIAEPLRITRFTYDSNGNMLTKVIQATSDSNGSQAFGATTIGAPQTWTFTYNQFGQPLTTVGPGTSTTMTYDSQNNLATVTNAAGHVTSYSNYDMNGRVGSITDPNGLTTNYVYGPRGWLDSVSVGGEVTTYIYDGVGNIRTVTLPDGSNITYQYDDAHRLTGITDSYGNNISYTLDLVGNKISEQVRDAGGTLTRQLSRVFDTLNRLKQITGAQQ